MNIAFIDTETTSLRHDRRAWEIGIIHRQPGHADTEHHWFIRSDDLDLGNADIVSLKIGNFYSRHPQYRSSISVSHQREADVLRNVEKLTRGAHLIGALPSFDAEVLATRMRANGICPSWHYHLIDIEPVMIGYLRGLGKPVPDLPWPSDELSRMVGVEPPGDAQRHTALGDADWVRRIWDKLMGGDAA